MSNDPTPFDLFKTYSGLIHRQPLFATHGLGVDRYHFTFLTAEGETLDNHAEVPEFIDSLSNMLATVSDHRRVLLSVPESWRQSLIDGRESTLQFTFVLKPDEVFADTGNSRIHFAHHAEQENAHHDSDSLLMVDMSAINPEQLAENASEWQQQSSQLFAINVNSQDDYGQCRQHRFNYCQGNFYTLPAISERQKMSPALQTLTELLVKLQDPDVEAEELASTVNQDVALSYKLLRLINSAFFGLPREVSSTQQAIVMLGQSKIKTWASLLSLSGIDDKPVELRIVAMTRARMCELLAKYYMGQPELFFAAGLFSTLDALMDDSLNNLVKKLPLSDELKTALIQHEGPAGLALRDCLNYEQANWSALDSSSVPVESLCHAYLDAIHWSQELNAQLTD